MIDEKKDEIQCLVLSPTRELASQTAIVYQFLGEILKIKVALVIGGTKLSVDLERLRQGPQVLVGSPGRVLDLIRRKQISLAYLQTFILDEADDLLSKGFLDNIKEITSLIPTTTKILLFSATMPRDIILLTNNFMNNPARILVKNEELTLEGIKQYYVYLKKEDKLVIALTPTCKEINKIPLEKMKAFVNDEVGKIIFDYAKNHPYIVKEYREDFPVLMYDEN